EVSACPAGSADPTRCSLVRTASNGTYTVTLAAGTWDLRVVPPASEPGLVPVPFPSVPLGSGQSRVVDVTLTEPVTAPPGRWISPFTGTVVPIVDNDQSTTVRTVDCKGGTGRWQLRQGPDLDNDGLGDRLIAQGNLTRNDAFSADQAEYT